MCGERKKQALLIRGGRVFDSLGGRDEISDLGVVNGVIAEAGAVPPGCPVFDARGCVVVPGLIDIHVHLREPGPNLAETIAGGTAAAARGGFTTVLAMPNVEPCPDRAAVLRDMVRRCRRDARIRVLLCGALTRGRRGRRIAALEEMAEEGAAAFSDDGTTVADESLLEEILLRCRKLDKPLLDHAQLPHLEQGAVHHGRVARRHGWLGIPRQAETQAVERDIRLAAKTGAKLHLQHLSTSGAVGALRQARGRGLPVSGEVTPHHLALTDAFLATVGTRAKMNPPLREPADRDALRHGLSDGTVTVLATDHAPHSELSGQSMSRAPFGVVGLETAVGVTYSLLVRKGLLSLKDWLDCWTVGPAAVLGMPAPDLAIGSRADVTVLDLENHWVVEPRQFAGGGRNTPFGGWRLWGRAVLTVAGGSPAYFDRYSRRLVSGLG